MTPKEWAEWMVKYSKYNTIKQDYDKNGIPNGIKVLTGTNGKDATFRRLTFTMDMVWPAPIGLTPVIKRQELWMDT